MEIKGSGHRGGHGEAVTTLAQCFEPVWYQQGGQIPIAWWKFRAALLGGLGICMIKETAEAAWASFVFVFSRPDVLRAEMLKRFGHFSDVLGGAT